MPKVLEDDGTSADPLGTAAEAFTKEHGEEYEATLELAQQMEPQCKALAKFLGQGKPPDSAVILAVNLLKRLAKLISALEQARAEWKGKPTPTPKEVKKKEVKEGHSMLPTLGPFGIQPIAWEGLGFKLDIAADGGGGAAKATPALPRMPSRKAWGGVKEGLKEGAINQHLHTVNQRRFKAATPYQIDTSAAKLPQHLKRRLAENKDKSPNSKVRWVRKRGRAGEADE